MANFLIDLYNKAVKGDSYRPTTTPDKYSDNIAALNATNQNVPKTSNLQKINNQGVANSGGNKVVPGH